MCAELMQHTMCCCFCRPLHIAVVQGELRVVERLVNLMSMLRAKVDHYNKLRQVCSSVGSTQIVITVQGQTGV